MSKRGGGERVGRLLTALAALTVASCGPVARKPGGKLLLFGIDGATWTVLGPAMANGRMPNLSRLAREGAHGPIKTLRPTESPRLWTSIATGVSPDVHGIESFVVKVPGKRKTTLPSSNMRRVKALWNILSDAGYTVGVVNWWASYPAERVNGFVISDRANYARKAGLRSLLNLTGKDMRARVEGETYPAELYDEISPSVRLAQDVDAARVLGIAALPKAALDHLKAAPAISRDDRLSVLKFMILQDDSAIASGLHAARKYGPEFLAFFIAGLDGIQHHFWKFLEPEKFPRRVTPEELRLYGGVIYNYCALVDEALGRFLSLYRGDELTVVVVSDHGQEAAVNHNRITDPSDYAAFASGDHSTGPDGILVLWGPPIRRGARIESASILDVTPTVLALMGVPVGMDMQGHVLRDAIDEGFLARFPVRTVASYGARRPDGTPAAPVTSEADEAVKERLRALGYIQ